MHNLFKYKYLYLYGMFAILVSCKNHHMGATNTEADNSASHTAQAVADSTAPKITTSTFQQKNGWGYDIFINDRLYIHQPNIPAVSGTNGFLSKEAAQRTADFVVSKVKNTSMPPAVSVRELDSLGVLNP